MPDVALALLPPTARSFSKIVTVAPWLAAEIAAHRPAEAQATESTHGQQAKVMTAQNRA
jgi:hypothetical protein